MFNVHSIQEASLSQYPPKNAFAISAGVISSTGYAYLCWVTQGFEQPSLIEFWAICLLNFCLSVGVCLFYQQQNRQVPIPLLILFALLFRFIGILGMPVFEDDFYRYLWDGRMFVETGNPYSLAPADFFDYELTDRFEHIVGLINHPDIATVYGPFNQYVFALGYLIAPGQLWPLQLFSIVADMAIVLILLKLTKANWVLLYAWSPLVIKEFAFTAHPDVFAIALLTGAFLTANKQHLILAAVLLALAAASKIFALLAVPFILRWNIKSWGAFTFTALTISLPFGVFNAWLPEGLKAMAEVWLFNAPLYFLLLNWFEFSQIKLTLSLLFLIFWSSYLAKALFFKTKFNNNIAIRYDYIYGIFFLCAPVLNAWYLIWLLPFATLRPSATVWAASLAVILAYAIGLNIPNSALDLYQQPIWAVIIESLIILTALCYDLIHSRMKCNIPGHA